MKLLWFAIFAIVALNGFSQDDPISKKTSGQNWLRVDIGIIGSASENVLESAIEKVNQENLDGLVIALDTPGGQLDSTRKMVKSMVAAPFPVVVWVGPGGAHAGSAGAFITIAANVAAMAEGTNIGAAHPIQSTGQDIGGKQQDENSKSKLEEKVLNDTLTFIESIAEMRGRNVEMARSFVSTSISITAKEALEHKVIDFIANDVDSLMKKIDGRKIKIDGGKRDYELTTSQVTFVVYEQTVSQRFLTILSNPNVFYLLFMAGIIGLGFELTHPGSIFPGVVGAICLILALIATSTLPVSFGAAVLILVGVGLLVAEAFVPSFGVLGIGGFAAFILGSVFLVDPSGTQGLRISWGTILPSAVAVAVVSLAIGYLIFKSEKSQVQTGNEAFVGKEARVLRDFENNQGKVIIDGEIWQAKYDGHESFEIKKDDMVKVKSVEGMILSVTT